MLEKNIILILTLFSTFSVFAKSHLKSKIDISYGDAHNKEVILKAMRHGHKKLSYKKQSRMLLFGQIHLREDSQGYFVKDVYCNKVHTKGVGPKKTPNHTIINVEHTWPQYRFSSFDRHMQKGDLHHLYPTDSSANSTRGHFEFAEVKEDKSMSKCLSSKRGFSKADGQRAFEPPREHKGNVARALFYFSIRYRIKINDNEEKFLRKWHELDPVDNEEIFRNEQIEEVQGNRNPFIDYPEMVNSIKNF